MALENGKWRVVKGDCLWNIAKAVYSNPYKWRDIANANGIPQSSGLIYPGQLLTLPNITSGGGANASPTPVTNNKVSLDWFCLVAGSEREMEAKWRWGKGDNRFWVRWQEIDASGNLWLISETKNYECSKDLIPESKASASENAKKIRISIRPTKDEKGTFQDNTAWVVKDYDFSNNPPQLPPTPDIEIDTNNVLTVTIDNIDEKLNADSIEIAVYKDDTIKYSTAKVPINKDARFAKYTTTVEPGHYYKVRCRAVRGTIYGGWTEFTSNEQSRPSAPTAITTLRPQIISEQMSKKYAVFAEWTEVPNAKTYEVQWTTNVEYFDVSSEVQSQTTEEGQGPRLLVTDLELGHEYFFRVRSNNDKGSSIDWSPIKSVILGSRPSAPTTWSNTTSNIVGEDLNLYWVHNATDSSVETYARLHITVIDSLYPDNEPMEYTKVIENTKPEEDKNKTSVYTINTSSDEWALVQSGFIIKWKVQTAGVASEYSEWSVEREVNVYAKPELELDILNQNGDSITEINGFPFYFSVLAKPAAQVPISYYLEVIANQSYETVNEYGNVKLVNAGDTVYQKYYDPETNAWEFMAYMTPGNINLANNIKYTVKCTVSMNSGLTATSSLDFNVYVTDLFYDAGADIIINKETLEATIHPYCKEYYEEYFNAKIIDGDGSVFTDADGDTLIYDERIDTLPKLVEGCTLSVYRREYDGSFTEIAKDIPNEENLYVTDPHPALDYARYRIVAKTDATGSISYSDIPAVKVGEPGIVIQWSEKWTNFESGENGEGSIEPAWSGSMLKLPYNVDVSDSNNIDVSLIEYVGRKHPVSYHGTQLGESSSWNTEIPAEDKETLYAIRRLKNWTDDVYVRESSGIGYWANISVSYNIKHKGVTIPVTFDVKRVEGGM